VVSRRKGYPRREFDPKGETMSKLTTFLWFDTEGEEAAKFYTSVFPNSKIVEVTPLWLGRATARGDGHDRRV
jgi:hypothetical protein